MKRKTKRKTIHGIPMPELEVSSLKITRPVSYVFGFKWGWAIFTINDDTGEFTITSDWGNYSHRWPADPVNLGGPNLTDFLRRMLRQDPRYVTEKFSYTNKRDLDDVVDEVATRKAFKRAIREAYKDRRIDQGEVREAIAELKDHLDLQTDDTIMRTIEWCSVLPRAVGPEPWNFIMHESSTRWLILQYALLPFFGRHLQKLDDAAQALLTGEAPT